MSQKWGWAEWVCAAIVVLAIPLTCAQLGYLPLWEDEGHTAVIARNLLRYGSLRLWDGINLVSGVNGEDVGPGLQLMWDGPVQFYLTALFFKLFGDSPAIARLPFVLFGLMCLPLTFCLTKRLTNNAWVSTASVALLITSAPFLMHIRQCRYYGVAVFCGLLLTYGYFGLSERRRHWIYFGLGGIGLFYTNPLSFVLLWTTMAIHQLIFNLDSRLRGNDKKGRTHDKKGRTHDRNGRGNDKLTFFWNSVVIAVVTTPWFIYAKLYARSGQDGPANIGKAATALFEVLYKFNRFFIPIVLWIAAYWMWRWRRKFTQWYVFCGVAFALSWWVIALFMSPGVRYAIWLIPLTAIFGAIFCYACYQSSRRAGILCFLILLCTHLPMRIPSYAIRTPTALLPDLQHFTTTEKSRTSFAHNVKRVIGKLQQTNQFYLRTDWWWRSLLKYDLLAYWHDIRHPFRDPNTGVANYLRTHAEPNDEALIAVGAFALMYALPELRQSWLVSDRTKHSHLAHLPDYIFSYDNVRWYIPRRSRRIKGPAIKEASFIRWAYGQGHTLKRHTIPYYTYDWDGIRSENIDQYSMQHRAEPRTIIKQPVVIYEVIRPRE